MNNGFIFRLSAPALWQQYLLKRLHEMYFLEHEVN